jgi:trans-2,3-dihydro-3-hydroxyanthranilate isomerase
MRYRYATLDVFTQARLAGNPLAVVFDADGLAPEQMQAIAREFNLSETVFLLAPEAAIHKARLRIFTPGRELPFAGHPTIGTAVLLGLRAETPLDAQAFGLEEGVGIVPCVVETKGERAGYARLRLPRLPEVLESAPDPVDAAWGLGLDPAEIGFDRHMPSRHSAGNPFDFVPVASLDAITRAKPAGEAFDRAFGANHPGVYVYCRETTETGHHFHARMFGSRTSGIYEDPATGSAVAAFAGVLMQFEPLGEGEHSFVIEQGYEMGRPSEIDLQITIREGALQAGEIGGHAVLVSEGEIEI